MVLAAIGWPLSIIVSFAVLAGAPAPQWLGALGGAFLVTFVGQILLFALRGDILHWRTLDEWAMDRSPSWARIASWVSAVYALCSIVAGFGFNSPTYIGAGWFALSGMFYAYALRMLMVTSRKLFCSNGHLVRPFSMYCRHCGAAVPEAM